MYNILIAAYSNWDTFAEVPAILKRGGGIVHAFCNENSWLIKNRNTDHIIICNEEAAGFTDELLRHIRQDPEKYQWIILADDLLLSLVNEKVDDPLFRKCLPLTKIENRQVLGSKAGFQELCDKYALRTPKTIVYDNQTDYRTICDKMDFPILIKIDRSNGGAGITYCDSKEVFLKEMEGIENKDSLVFQEFINGYDVNVEALYKDGKLLVYNYARVLKTLFNSFGASTMRTFYKNAEIEADLIKIGSSFGINGFASIAFMYDEIRQKHYLFEADLRPNSWHYYGKFTGADFTKGVKKFIQNDLTLLPVPAKYRNKVITINLFKKDMHRCIQSGDKKGLFDWLINRNGRWSQIPFYDRKLLFSCVKFLFGISLMHVKMSVSTLIRKLKEKTKGANLAQPNSHNRWVK